MSGGVNVKSAPRAPALSGIPLPHSLLPSSPKAETRRRPSDLPRPSTQTPKYTPTHTPTDSPSLCLRSSSIPGPSTQDPTRNPGLKSQLFKWTRVLPAPQVSRSAYSSPITQRRVPLPHSKDTLDLVKPQHLPSQFLHDGDRNRNTFTNKNQTCRTSKPHPPLQFRRGVNSNTVCHATSEVMSQREEEVPETPPAQSPTLNNSNLCPSLAQTSYKDAISGCSDSTSQSDEEMGTPEDNSPASSPCPMPLPPIVFTVPVMSKVAVDMLDQSLNKEATSTETQAPRINMATVAPFSYRQVVCTRTHARIHACTHFDCPLAAKDQPQTVVVANSSVSFPAIHVCARKNTHLVFSGAELIVEASSWQPLGWLDILFSLAYTQSLLLG